MPKDELYNEEDQAFKDFEEEEVDDEDSPKKPGRPPIGKPPIGRIQMNKPVSRIEPIAIPPPAPKEPPRRIEKIGGNERQRTEIEKKFEVFSMPERVGIFDVEEQKPFIEGGDLNSTILMVLNEILNKLDRLERSMGA